MIFSAETFSTRSAGFMIMHEHTFCTIFWLTMMPRAKFGCKLGNSAEDIQQKVMDIWTCRRTDGVNPLEPFNHVIGI